MPKTTFRPQTDGFAFANSWNLKDDLELCDTIRGAYQQGQSGVPYLLGGIFGAGLDALGLGAKLAAQAVTGQMEPYGMCGGMAYAALDYWRAGLVVNRGQGQPPLASPPAAGGLRDYIRDRMCASLTAGGGAGRTVQWSAILHLVPPLPFHGGPSWLKQRSYEEFHRLKGKIDAGQPWPIVLVGADPNLFYQHQVLAYGYEDRGDGTALLYVYDNNSPNAENTIGLDFRGDFLQPGAGMDSCPGLRGALRGFFCSDYEFHSPPVTLGLSAGLACAGDPVLGSAITLSFTARNAGCGPTPPLALRVTGLAGPKGDVPVDAGGETDLQPIPEGGSRTLTVTTTLARPGGLRTYRPAAYLGSCDGTDIWRDIPALDNAAVHDLRLRVTRS